MTGNWEHCFRAIKYSFFPFLLFPSLAKLWGLEMNSRCQCAIFQCLPNGFSLPLLELKNLNYFFCMQCSKLSHVHKPVTLVACSHQSKLPPFVAFPSLAKYASMNVYYTLQLSSHQISSCLFSEKNIQQQSWRHGWSELSCLLYSNLAAPQHGPTDSHYIVCKQFGTSLQHVNSGMLTNSYFNRLSTGRRIPHPTKPAWGDAAVCG